MGDVKRAVKRGWNSLGKMWNDVVEGSKQVGEKIGLGGVVHSDKTETKQRRAREAAAAANRPIPLPDEEELQRAARRRAARRTGGRASTVLSEEDRLGP